MSLYEEMLSQADPSQVAGLSRFFKTGPGQYGEGDKFLGIKVPVTRSVVSRCWKTASWAELEKCISSEYHEVRLAALLTLVEIFKHARKTPMVQQQCIDFYLAHTLSINNWDLVDLSCYPLLGEWLLDKDRTLLYDLARDGRTIWEQRIGIVSTMTFVRHGQLEDCFAIADILLHHPHDLIHKAVGWLLREAGKRDQPALEDFLRHPRPDRNPSEARDGDRPGGKPHPRPDWNPSEARDGDCQGGKPPRYLEMPRTMLRYAIERFPEAERQSYLNGHAH